MEWLLGHFRTRGPGNSDFEAQELVESRRKRVVRVVEFYLSLLLAGLAVSQLFSGSFPR